MLKIETEQYGLLTIEFRHNSGDPGVTLKRRLAEYYRSVSNLEDRRLTGAEHDEVNSFIDGVLDVVDILYTMDTVLLVDTGKHRYTECQIKLDGSFYPETDSGRTPEPIYNTFGYAWVFPTDTFVKEDGRLLSLKRAMDELPGITRKTRAEIWSGYYNR